jgi:hypothetical protein
MFPSEIYIYIYIFLFDSILYQYKFGYDILYQNVVC